jgi:hypothetical protein
VLDNTCLCSAVLLRVQAFLPVLKEENAKLERQIREQGQKSVQIDAGLENCGETSLGTEDNVTPAGTTEEPGELLVEDSGSAQVPRTDIGEADGQRIVQVEFALGDFDHSNVAQLENDA